MSKICLKAPGGNQFRSGSTATRFYKTNGIGIKPAAKMLPPTQARPTMANQMMQQSGGSASLLPPPPPNRIGFSAMRARLSPAWSLFNRLDEFVTQLEASRDFFAEWPQNLCQKIREDALIVKQQQLNNNKASGMSQQASFHNPHQNSSGSQINSASFSASCWNGADFGA